MKFVHVAAQIEFNPNGNVEVGPPTLYTGYLIRDTGLDSDWVFWYYPYLMFGLYFYLEQIIKYIYIGKPVLSDPLTYLELIEFGFCIAYIGLNLVGEEYRPALMQVIVIQGTSYTLPIDGPFYYQTAYMYYTASNLLSVVCLLYWVKFITYLGTIPRLAFLGRVFNKVAGKLLGFFIVFFILLVAFAQAYYLVFSTSLDSFLTTSLACFSMVRALTGGLDLQPMFDAEPFYTIAFYVIFVSVMIFTMLTIVLAIVSEDGYKKVAQELHDEDKVAERRGQTGVYYLLTSSLANYKKQNRVELKRDRKEKEIERQVMPKNM